MQFLSRNKTGALLLLYTKVWIGQPNFLCYNQFNENFGVLKIITLNYKYNTRSSPAGASPVSHADLDMQ